MFKESYEKILNEDVSRVATLKLPWEKFKNKTFLLTGATGNIGTYVVHTLLTCSSMYNLDIKLICLCRSREKAAEKFERVMDREELVLLFGALTDFADFGYKPDYIIHMASETARIRLEANPVNVIEANLTATNELLKLAHEKNCGEFIFFSSSAVYGQPSEEGILEEDFVSGSIDFSNPSFVYHESKRTGEMICRCYKKQYGVNIKIIRPNIVYGPGMCEHEKKAFTDFLFDTLKGRDILIKSSGTVTKSYCYISDAIAGIFTVILRGESGEAYNVSNEQEVFSVKDLACCFAETDGSIKVICGEETNKEEYLKTLVNSVVVSTKKLERLGWKAEISLKEGIARTLESYRGR